MDLSGDWEYITEIANVRRAHNRTPRHIDVFYLEVIGAAGELAARRFLGLREELHRGFDGGCDFYWHGRAVDVKTTKFTPLVAHRYLQWPVWKQIKSEIVLMVGVSEAERIAVPLGFAFADEVLAAPINTQRATACHEIPVPELHPVWELFTLQPQSANASRTEPLYAVR